jgi:hypothetical protein
VTTAPQLPAAPAQQPPPSPRRSSRGAVRARASLRRQRRPSRRPAAIVVSLLLLTAGALTVTGIVLALAERPWLVPPVERFAREVVAARWDDPAVLVTAGVAVAVGLLLLALALVPGRLRGITLSSDGPDVLVTTSRRTLRRQLARDAARITGVHDVRVTVRRRRAVVRVRGNSRANTQARAEVERAVAARLDELAPLRPLAVRVRWREVRR